MTSAAVNEYSSTPQSTLDSQGHIRMYMATMPESARSASSDHVRDHVMRRTPAQGISIARKLGECQTDIFSVLGSP